MLGWVALGPIGNCDRSAVENNESARINIKNGWFYILRLTRHGIWTSSAKQSIKFRVRDFVLLISLLETYLGL